MTLRMIISGRAKVLDKGVRGEKGDQGDRGLPGPPGGVGANASGTWTTPNIVQMMQHNLGIAEADLNPNIWYFEDQDGNPMEPISVQYVNDNVALSTWIDPVVGSWLV